VFDRSCETWTREGVYSLPSYKKIEEMKKRKKKKEKKMKRERGTIEKEIGPSLSSDLVRQIRLFLPCDLVCQKLLIKVRKCRYCRRVKVGETSLVVEVGVPTSMLPNCCING
jgi:hypothetical protein